MKRILTLAYLAITTLLPLTAQEVSTDLKMHDFKTNDIKRYLTLDGELSANNPHSAENDISWTCFDTDGRLIRDAVWRVYAYDQYGRYTHGQFQGATLQRNDLYQIINVDGGPNCGFEQYYNDTFTYTPSGQVKTKNYSCNFSAGTITYKYNANNELISSHTEYDAEGTEGVIDETYIITKRDRRGNWIERKVHYKEVTKEYEGESETSEYDNIQSRYIEYYVQGEKSLNAETYILPVEVTGTNVRLRLGPSTSHQIFTQSGKTVYPPRGAKLRYVGETDDFYQVEYKNARVYISKQFSARMYQ